MNDDHAVTSVGVQLKLDEFVEPAALNEATQTDPGWKADLPALTSLPAVTLANGVQAIEVPGIQSAIVRPNGTPIWALRLHGVDLTVECSTYTRWADIWGKARGYLERAFALVKRHQPDVHILEVNLAVADAFVTDDHDYLANELFRAGGFLGDGFLSRGGSWHCNTGWFDEEPVRVLHALNIQATGRRDGAGKPKGPYRFTVMHSQRASNLGDFPFEKVSPLVSDVLHENNKSVLQSVVSDEMLKRIGL